MKYLLLFLISFNCFANFKVVAINSKYNRKYGAKFESLMEAQAWASEQANDGSWGKNDRWLSEEIEGYTNTRLVQDAETGEQYTEYFYPKEYSYTIEDISAQVKAEKDAIEAEKLERKQIKAAIQLINDDADMKPYVKKILKRLIRDMRD